MEEENGRLLHLHLFPVTERVITVSGHCPYVFPRKKRVIHNSYNMVNWGYNMLYHVITLATGGVESVKVTGVITLARGGGCSWKCESLPISLNYSSRTGLSLCGGHCKQARREYPQHESQDLVMFHYLPSTGFLVHTGSFERTVLIARLWKQWNE